MLTVKFVFKYFIGSRPNSFGKKNTRNKKQLVVFQTTGSKLNWKEEELTRQEQKRSRLQEAKLSGNKKGT